MGRIVLAVAASCLLVPTPLWGQVPAPSWRVVPQLGLAFHGGYYDDVVVTTFADGAVNVDRLEIDPGTAVRVGATAEYAFTPVVWLYGGLAGSWPEGDVVEDGELRPDIDMQVVELTAGALFRLGQWGTARVFPFYVGGDVTLAWHSFDELIWEGQPTDVTTTSLGLSGRFGVEYALGPKASLRGEARQLLIRGGYGGLEDELAAAAAQEAGMSAQTELEGNTFSAFLLNAGLVIRF